MPGQRGGPGQRAGLEPQDFQVVVQDQDLGVLAGRALVPGYHLRPVEHVVPPSGNMTVGPQQFWLGTSRAGQQVRFWIDTTTVHLSIDGWRIKTVPSRLSAVDLARLRQHGACPAGPPPAGNAPGALAADSCVEVQRLANAAGIITLGNRVIQVGSPLAGQRATIRLDGQVMRVITQDGTLWRTLPCPIPPGQRHRLQGVRLAGPGPLPQPRLTIQRRVSSRGGIQVARQRIQVGLSHAGKTVTIQPADATLRVIDQHGELITPCPATAPARSADSRPTAPGAHREACLPDLRRIRRTLAGSTSFVLGDEHPRRSSCVPRNRGKARAGVVHDLVASAWLHDIGYAPELIDTGFHPLDGARYLRRVGVGRQVVSLVAYHSCAQLGDPCPTA